MARLEKNELTSAYQNEVEFNFLYSFLVKDVKAAKVFKVDLHCQIIFC